MMGESFILWARKESFPHQMARESKVENQVGRIMMPLGKYSIGGLTCLENPPAIYGGIESQIVASEPTPRFSAEDPNTILERGSQHS